MSACAHFAGHFSYLLYHYYVGKLQFMLGSDCALTRSGNIVCLTTKFISKVDYSLRPVCQAVSADSCVGMSKDEGEA